MDYLNNMVSKFWLLKYVLGVKIFINMFINIKGVISSIILIKKAKFLLYIKNKINSTKFIN